MPRGVGASDNAYLFRLGGTYQKAGQTGRSAGRPRRAVVPMLAASHSRGLPAPARVNSAMHHAPHRLARPGSRLRDRGPRNRHVENARRQAVFANSSRRRQFESRKPTFAGSNRGGALDSGRTYRSSGSSWSCRRPAGLSPASARGGPKGFRIRVSALSDCLSSQAICHGLRSRSMAFRIVRSFRIAAMTATLPGRPAATRR